MKLRKTVNLVTGAAQEAIGLASAVLAVMLLFNILDVQAVFNLPTELLPLILLVLVLFSLFSIASGAFLIREGREEDSG